MRSTQTGGLVVFFHSNILFLLYCFSNGIEMSFGVSEPKRTDSAATFRKKIEPNVCIFQRLLAILNISSKRG